MSDTLRARLLAGALWTLVALSAAGGVAGWLRGPEPRRMPVEQTDVVGLTAEPWAAGGFALRFVETYLDAAEPEVLEEFLGYRPDVAAERQASATTAPATVVGVERVEPSYWAVTVATGPATQPAHWRVGVSTAGGRLVAVALPSPVPGPPAGERADLAVVLGEPPAGAPEVLAVEGFLAAHLCGDGALDRFLAPGTEVEALAPSVCSGVEVERWGSRLSGSGGLQVVVEAVLDPGLSARTVSVALELARRDGRWEVAEVLVAPPLADGEVSQ